MGIEYLDILIFAVIAGILIYRLRNVLGRRTGNERPRANPYQRPSESETVASDNVVTLPGRQRDDADALLGEEQRIGAAETATSTRDESDLSVEQAHGWLLGVTRVR